MDATLHPIPATVGDGQRFFVVLLSVSYARERKRPLFTLQSVWGSQRYSRFDIRFQWLTEEAKIMTGRSLGLTIAVGSRSMLEVLADTPGPVTSIFEPLSTPADSIYEISMLTLAICGVIFADRQWPADLYDHPVSTPTSG